MHEEKDETNYFLIAVGLLCVLIGGVGILIMPILANSSSSSYEERYQNYEANRASYIEKMTPIVKQNYDILMDKAVKIACVQSAECYETPFCEIKKAGTQTVVYDSVSKQKLATFSEDFYPYSEGETKIAAFCTGERNAR